MKRYITLLDDSKLIYLGSTARIKFPVQKYLYKFENKFKNKPQEFATWESINNFRFYGAMPHFGLTLNEDGTFSLD